MLSSSPSLLSALSLAPSVAGDTAPAGAAAAPGFAELLNGLATKAAEAISGEDAGEQGGDKAAAAGEKAATKGKTITVRAGRLALAAEAAAADGKAVPAGIQPAAATLAAIESGKILPVVLPEAADAETKADAGTETDAAPTAATPTAASPLPALPGVLPILPVQAGEIAATTPAATTPRRTAATVAQALPAKVNKPAGQPGDQGRPEAPSAESRPAPTVAVTVAAPAATRAPQAVEAAATRAPTPIRAKSARAADLARAEAPLPQLSVPAAPVAQLAPAAPSASAVVAPAPAMPAPMPSPHDINAALDHLVAAREALMPAEAALAIDHHEFGEVSIKFEQSSDGRLSAELSAADPELQRAVTAAVAADHRPAMTSDGDGGRSAQLANHRGAAQGGDASQGQRSQSGAHGGADRDLPQRRANASPRRQAATDQGSGVFA